MAAQTQLSRRAALGAAPLLAGLLAACASSRRASSSSSAGSGAVASTVLPPAGSAVGAASSPAPASSVAVTDAPSTSTAAAAGGPAQFVDHGPATTNNVALTFHFDGPPALVTSLLDIVEQRGVPITAFAVGSWLTAHPALGQRVIADGHELGNHTEHHLDMPKLNRQQIHDEIAQCAEALKPFDGSIGTWFRASATVVPSEVILEEAGKVGYRWYIGYDVDSRDNTDPGSAAVITSVKTGLHPGAIVSLHFGHAGTVKALPAILDHIVQRGFTPVKMSTLLGVTA